MSPDIPVGTGIGLAQDRDILAIATGCGWWIGMAATDATVEAKQSTGNAWENALRDASLI